MSRTNYGSHAYWRVLGGQTGMLDIWAAYSAMAFKDESGSPISASGGSIVESGHWSTFSASNLFDGSDTTFWESSNAGSDNNVPYCGYQFSSAQAVMQIGLQKHASMDGSFPATIGFFECSDDGVTWTTVCVANVADALTSNDTMVWFNFAGGL